MKQRSETHRSHIAACLAIAALMLLSILMAGCGSGGKKYEAQDTASSPDGRAAATSHHTGGVN